MEVGSFFVSNSRREAGVDDIRLTHQLVDFRPEICTKPFSIAEFFKDSPWLNIPFERQAILIAPLYPRGGLLGGAPEEKKMSKLQALAAARKKKAQEQKGEISERIEKPMAGLSLLNGAKPDERVEPKFNKAEKDSSTVPKQHARGFPVRKRKDSNPHEKSPKAQPPKPEEQEENVNSIEIMPIDQAEPSEFANTMFSSITRPATEPASLFTLPYVAKATILTDPFSGPSPDDIVLAAQSKGSAISGKPKK